MKRLTTFEEFKKQAAAGVDMASKTFDAIKSLGQVAASTWKGLPLWGKVLAVGIPALGIAEYFGRPFGIGGLFGDKTRQAETTSYRINRVLHSLADRIRLDEIAAEAFTKSLASSSANELVGLTKDTLSKAYENTKALFTSPVRKALFETIRRETPELRDVPIAKLQEAYHTMVKFAPTLAEDKNAVKSFLIQAVVSGSGIDYGAIKGIAEAERAVNRAREA